MNAIAQNLKQHPTLMLRLLFALLLMFAQQAVLQHPYSHDNEWRESSSQQQQDKKSPHTDQCTRCIAIAGISGAITVQALVLHAPAAHLDLWLAELPVYVSSTHLPYRSRAPPILA